MVKTFTKFQEYTKHVDQSSTVKDILIHMIVMIICVVCSYFVIRTDDNFILIISLVNGNP